MFSSLDECLNVLISTGRLPEAAFFARTYLPSQLSRSVAISLEVLLVAKCLASFVRSSLLNRAHKLLCRLWKYKLVSSVISALQGRMAQDVVMTDVVARL